MTANGQTPTLASHAAGVTGEAYGDDVNQEIVALSGEVFTELSISGTANALTATSGKSLASLSAGDKFILTPTSDNSGAATINIDTIGDIDLLDQDGAALSADNLVTGRPTTGVIDSGGDLRLLGVSAASTRYPGWALLANRRTGANGGGTTTNSNVDYPLNTKVAESNLSVSGTLPEFTLPAGQYQLFFNAQLYETGGAAIDLYDVTNTSVVANTVYPIQTKDIGGNDRGHITHIAIVDISTATTFKYRATVERTGDTSHEFGDVSAITEFASVAVDYGYCLISERKAGEKGDTGDAGLNWRGSWDGLGGSAAIAVGDAVSNDGASYICTAAHTQSLSNEAGVGASWQSYWDLLASAGETGETGALSFAETLKGEQAIRLLGGYPEGLAIDFKTDGMAVMDEVTLENYYAGPVTGFTRSSSAMAINRERLLETAATDEMRRHYDAETGELQGVLLEGTRSNFFTYSEQFDHANWTKASVTITANDTLSPDAATTADKLVESAAAGEHYVYQAKSITSGLTYTASFFVKADERTNFRIQFGAAGFGTYANARADFDISAGTVGTVGSSITATKIEVMGNGWYRVQASCQATATTSSAAVAVLHNGTSSSYVGDGSSGLYVWGGQFEAGLSASSYIHTTTAAVARAVDLIDIALSTIPYNIEQGTLSLRLRTKWKETSGGDVVFNLYLNSSNYVRIYVHPTENQIVGSIRTAGIDQLSGVVGTIPASDEFSVILAWRANDVEIYVDGVSAATDTSVTIPDLTGGSLKTALTGGSMIQSTIYIPQRLTAAEIARLDAIT